jgi:hypothetical protein
MGVVCMFTLLHKALFGANSLPRVNEMDSSDTNLFDHIDLFQQSLFGRTFLSYVPENIASQILPAQTDLATVFIVKSVLDGLENDEHCSETSQSVWFRRIWRDIVRRVATNSRTTHWAAEIRGDLYETFRDKTYRLPWQWKATIKFTTEENGKKKSQRKVVERLRVGTTDLSNYEIAKRSTKNTSSEQGIAADQF